MTVTIIHFRHFCYPHYFPARQKIRKKKRTEDNIIAALEALENMDSNV